MIMEILHFNECEQSMDVQNIIGDIVKCGGKIITQQADYDEETCRIAVDIPDDFHDKFKATDSWMIMI